MRNTRHRDGLQSYEWALNRLQAMSRGKHGTHWELWLFNLKEAQQAPPATIAEMRPLTEEEEGWLWEAYHHAGAISHETPRVKEVHFDFVFDEGLPWLLTHGKMSWARLATRWMTEATPANPPTEAAYQEISLRNISKEERVHGFHVRLGVEIANADSGQEDGATAAHRSELRHQLLATMADAPTVSGWRGLISPDKIWGWPEFLLSPAYANARTRPINEPLALGSGMARIDLLDELLSGVRCLPGTAEYKMAIDDLSPPTTTNISEWETWAIEVSQGLKNSLQQQKSLKESLWHVVSERLIRSGTVPPLEAARLLRIVLESMTPPATACDAVAAWWDIHREELRTKNARPDSRTSQPLLGEILLDSVSLTRTPAWPIRYASPEMTRGQAANVFKWLTPRTWLAVESVMIEWGRQDRNASFSDETFCLFEEHEECPITQSAHWAELYVTQCAGGHAPRWLTRWIERGRFPLTPLPQATLRRLLEAPDRKVREYAIRSMAQHRAPQNTPVADSAPPRHLA